MSRLTADREAEIFGATLRLVAERGFDAVTMDAIAHESHSSKATLYRQWDDKVGLVIESLAHLKGGENDLPDTGTLAGDVHAIVDAHFADFAGAGLLIIALLHAAARHPDLESVLRERFVRGSRGDIERLIERAIERGLIAPSVEVLTYGPMLFGAPIVLHLLTEDGTLAPRDLHDYVDHIFLPLFGIHPSEEI